VRPIAIVFVAAVLLGSSVGEAVAQPTLSKVEPTADGYVLAGKGFGGDRARVQVLENGAALPAAAVVSLTDERILVRSRPAGRVEHRVVVAGRASAGVTFGHQSAAKPGATSRATAVAPKTLTLPTVSATGRRPEARPPKSLTLGTVSATGYRPEPQPPKTLTLGTVSATGYRP
jgi:hypothetical protein